MPNPNAVVSSVRRVEPMRTDDAAGAESMRKSAAEVVLGEDRAVRLDPADDRSPGFANILERLAALKRPVYLEVSPDTGFVTRLLVPAVSPVATINTREDGSLEVHLVQSHARLALRTDTPYFGEFAEILHDALRRNISVIVTQGDANSIIDVRFFRPGPDGEPPLFPKQTFWLWRPFRWVYDVLWWIWRWPFWPWRWFGCISATKAQQVFDAMNAKTCDPLTIPPPCIPFLYPNDGCWGRAHEMVRLMKDMGLNPKKVWIQGSLTAQTKNDPNCHVHWGWHVAPTLCVRNTWFLGKQQVIDPSLFTTPVSKSTWKGVQGDPSATLTDTTGSYYHYIANIPDDPGYASTNQVLETYRLALQARALQDGPPPYANCP